MEKRQETIKQFLISEFFFFFFCYSIQLGNFMCRADSFLVQPTGVRFFRLIGSSILVSVLLAGLFMAFMKACASRTAQKKQGSLSLRGVLASWQFFGILWLVMFVLFLVCFLAYYPGAYAYDIHWQTAQATGYYAYNTHHPPLHTWIWSLCIRAGAGDLSKALVIYGIGQMLLVSGVLANMVRVMAKSCGNIGIVVLAVLFVCLNPVFAIFSFIMTKDVMFSALFCLFMTSFYQCVKGDTPLSGKSGLRLAVEMVACCFFRKNAWPAFAACGILAWFIKKSGRKEIFRFFIIPILAFLIISKGGAGLLKMEKGSIAEAMNTPMMQISYTAYREWDSLTPRIQEKISEFITLEEIRENYDPLFADTIKDHFDLNNEMGEKKFLRFCILYGELLLKYPGDYLYAVLHLSQPYWYPVVIADTPYHNPEYISTGIILNDSIVRQSRFPHVHELYEQVAGGYEAKKNPLLYPCFSLSLPLWLMLFGVMILWVGKRYDRIGFYLPALFLWITYALGPVALSRYMLPFMFCYPLFVGNVFSGSGDSEERELAQ